MKPLHENSILRAQFEGPGYNPMLAVREEEVAALRTRVAYLEEALEVARAEAFHLAQAKKMYASHLYLLAQAVLSGEQERAQELAHRALDLVRRES